MTPERYARHRERVLYLSDHPLGTDGDDDTDREVSA